MSEFGENALMYVLIAIGIVVLLWVYRRARPHQESFAAQYQPLSESYPQSNEEMCYVMLGHACGTSSEYCTTSMANKVKQDCMIILNSKTPYEADRIVTSTKLLCPKGSSAPACVRYGLKYYGS